MTFSPKKVKEKKSKMPKKCDLEWIHYLSFIINIIELDHHLFHPFSLLHG